MSSIPALGKRYLAISSGSEYINKELGLSLKTLCVFYDDFVDGDGEKAASQP